MNIKRFTVYRPAITEGTHDNNQANPPDEAQFEGVIFTDGTVALRWLTACRSTSLWEDYETMYKVHGHPEYGTKIHFHDQPDIN